jgi:chemotaxis protein CheC
MTTPNDLESLRRDGLREVATIGAGHAATALSQLTDRRIMISVPNVRRVVYGELPALLNSFGDHVAIVSMRMLGDLTGRALLAFSEDDAGRLCDMILRRPLGPPRALGELEQSGLKEVGNIVCSAYLTALSNFMQMMLLPSVPSLTIGPTAHAIASTVDPKESDHDMVFCVDTAFRAEGREDPLTGAFLLMPDPVSVQAILEAIRLD